MPLFSHKIIKQIQINESHGGSLPGIKKKMDPAARDRQNYERVFNVSCSNDGVGQSHKSKRCRQNNQDAE